MRSKVLPLLISGLFLASCGQSDSAKDGEQLAKSAGDNRKSVDEIDWGTDDGDFANDGECDDPRFEGYAMTDTGLLVEDIKKDATDCKTAYEQGALELK